MDSKLFLSACFVGVLLVLWHSEAAPVDTLSDREQLRRTLYRLDRVLDELVQRTEDSHTYVKRNEDGSLPYKRNEDGNIPYRRNEDGNIPYRRNEDGNIPYRRNEDRHFPVRRNEDGNIPYQPFQEDLPYRSLRALYEQKRNEDGNLPYKRNEGVKVFDAGSFIPKLKKDNGPVPYRTIKRANEDDIPRSDRTSENNLRKVLRYLADMEDKLQKRDHDIPFPFVGKRSHEK